MTKVEVFAGAGTLVQHAAEALAAAAAEAIAQRGRFLLCLSGGSTPRPLYERLASEPFASRIAWDRVHVFFGDERCVPPNDPASNYHMVREALLARVPVPEAQVHRAPGELEPARSAAHYEGVLRAELGVTVGDLPARGFDLVLLGLGSDGHTASLFPHSIDAPEPWVAARLDPTGKLWRVTLLPRVLMAAQSLWFLVSGADKAGRVAEVLTGPLRPDILPAQRIRPPVGGLTWLLDADAARELLESARSARAERFALEVHT